MHRKIGFTAILILVLGLLIRLSNLNSLPVFADESIYIRWSQVMKAESTLRFLPLSDGKQPMFMWLLMPILKFIADPLVAGRILSICFDLGTVISIGFLGYFLFKKISAGLLAALLWATAPYAIFFGRMALVDSTLTFFIITGFIFAYLSISKLRWDFAMVSGLTFGLAWLTKSPAMFILLMLPLLSVFTPKPITRSLIFNLLFLYSTIYLLSSGLYQVLRLGPEFYMIAIRNRDYIWAIHEVIKHPLDPLIPHLRDSFLFFFLYLNPILLFIILFKIKNIFQKSYLILFTFLLIPIIVQSFIAKVITARYLLYTIPFAILIVSKFNYKFLLTGILINLLLCWQLIYFPTSFIMPRIERAGYLEEWTSGYGIKEVSQYLEKINSPVVVGSEGFFGTPFSALEMYLNHKKNIRVIGVGVWIDTVSDKLTNAKKDNQVFLVVNSSRLKVDYSKLNLELLASYPKAISPAGKQESLLFFKVK